MKGKAKSEHDTVRYVVLSKPRVFLCWTWDFYTWTYEVPPHKKTQLHFKTQPESKKRDFLFITGTPNRKRIYLPLHYIYIYIFFVFLPYFGTLMFRIFPSILTSRQKRQKIYNSKSTKINFSMEVRHICQFIWLAIILTLRWQHSDPVLHLRHDKFLDNILARLAQHTRPLQKTFRNRNHQLDPLVNNWTYEITRSILAYRVYIRSKASF